MDFLLVLIKLFLIGVMAEVLRASDVTISNRRSNSNSFLKIELNRN